MIGGIIMTDIFTTEILAPVTLAIVGGIGWWFKHMIEKRDEERNKKRDKIESDITELKTEVKSLKRKVSKTQAIILNCDKPDCPSKKILAELIEEEE